MLALEAGDRPLPDWLEVFEEQLCRYAALWIHGVLIEGDPHSDPAAAYGPALARFSIFTTDTAGRDPRRPPRLGRPAPRRSAAAGGPNPIPQTGSALRPCPVAAGTSAAGAIDRGDRQLSGLAAVPLPPAMAAGRASAGRSHGAPGLGGGSPGLPDAAADGGSSADAPDPARLPQRHRPRQPDHDQGACAEVPPVGSADSSLSKSSPLDWRPQIQQGAPGAAGQPLTTGPYHNFLALAVARHPLTRQDLFMLRQRRPGGDRFDRLERHRPLPAEGPKGQQTSELAAQVRAERGRQ